MSDSDATTTTDFDALVRYIEDEFEFASSYYNESYLDRRISARMRRTGVDTYAEYLEYLRRVDEEEGHLLDSLSINVTSFFRNPEMWEHLRLVLRELTNGHRQVNVWSAPCSDGREPYSLAMLALDDPETDASSIDITATDISAEVLEKARAGVYETTATIDIEDELGFLDEPTAYVEQEADRFAVGDAVKDMVTFERQDLIRDDPMSGIHLAMCRNLLIYIAEEYKEPIVGALDASLAEGGYLVIGMTETLPRAYKSRYEPIHGRSRIHRKTS